MKYLLLCLLLIGCTSERKNEEKPALSCEDQIEEDAKSCKDINCKLEYIAKLRKCFE